MINSLVNDKILQNFLFDFIIYLYFDVFEIVRIIYINPGNTVLLDLVVFIYLFAGNTDCLHLYNNQIDFIILFHLI